MTRFVGATALLATCCLLPAVGAEPPPTRHCRMPRSPGNAATTSRALTTYQDAAGRPRRRRACSSRSRCRPASCTGRPSSRPTAAAPQISARRAIRQLRNRHRRSRVTRVVVTGAGVVAGGWTVTPVAELHGYGAVVLTGQLQTGLPQAAPSPALTAAYGELERTPQAERAFRLAALNARCAVEAAITVRDLASGRETELKTDELIKSSLVFGPATCCSSRRDAAARARRSRSTRSPKAGRRRR